MSDYNIQIKHLQNDTWDNLYPITSAIKSLSTVPALRNLWRPRPVPTRCCRLQMSWPLWKPCWI
jgi:hypothetical protein